MAGITGVVTTECVFDQSVEDARCVRCGTRADELDMQVVPGEYTVLPCAALGPGWDKMYHDPNFQQKRNKG